jgi:hypothetical protein
MMKKYYWLASYDLKADSIVNPGNWGRIINKYSISFQSCNPVALREYIFEVVRLKSFSYRPSRLECLFLSGSRNVIDELKKQRPFDILYEVQIIDEKLGFFEADMRIAGFPANPQTIEGVALFADQYWRAEGEIDQKEVLTLSPIKIINKIS